MAKTKEKTKKLTVSAELTQERHRAIIDEYYINGFKKSNAVLTILQNTNQSTAATMFDSIVKMPVNAEYMKIKSVRLSAMVDIRNEQILRELINWAYSDITVFMGCTEDEIKLLPPDVRRCIQSYKTTVKEFTDRDGAITITTTTEIKMVSKTDAIKEAAKHIGFYAIDNKQKKTEYQLTQFNNSTLNSIAQVLKANKD